MMDDYELQNARTWDDSIEHMPESSRDEQFQWQELKPSKNTLTKKEQKQPIRPAQENLVPRPVAARASEDASPVKAQVALPQPQPRPLRAQQQYGPRVPAARVTARPARRWESAHGCHAAARPAVPKHPMLRIDAESDNEAQMAWRQRRPPADTVRIAPEIALPEDSRRNLQIIASNMGCFIFCEELHQGSGSLAFGIWGDAQDVVAVKNRLILLAEDLMPRGQFTGNFAKVCSLTPALRERHERRWEREVKRNKYRQHPSRDMTLSFAAIGSFHWPSNEYEPEEVFGMSFEALDPIRMDLSCYIVYLPELSLFRAMGKIKNVQAAILRIRQTCFQLAARSINPVRAYNLRHSKDEKIPSHVYLEDYQTPTIVTPKAQLGEEGLQQSPRGEGWLVDQQKIDAERVNSAMSFDRVKATLANALRKLHHFQGNLQLRVKLGTFLVIQYLVPECEPYQVKEYKEMTKESAFMGRVTEELGDRFLERNLLSRMQNASDLLIPHDAMSDRLSEVKPIYSVTFIFEDQKGDMRLCMTWHENEVFGQDRSELSLEQSKWTRMDRDTGNPTQLLDMSLTELHTGSAWQFEIQASRAVEPYKVPPILRNFAEKVRIDSIMALKQSVERLWVNYNPYTQPKSIRQEISYHYGIKGTDYTLDITRFQDRFFTIPDSVVKKTETKTFEPRWSVNVFRTEWDTMFSKNERLAIGGSADWDHDIDHWFDKDMGSWEATSSDGFSQMVERMEAIEKAIGVPWETEEE